VARKGVRWLLASARDVIGEIGRVSGERGGSSCDGWRH